MNKNIKAIYPGSFDPLTLGHLDIIKRTIKIVDKLVVAIGNNSKKEQNKFFNPKLNQQLISQCLQLELPNDYHKIEVKLFDGLLIKFAQQEQANIIVRGLRALSDFDFEFSLASGNQALNPDIESVFLMTSINKQFISSKLAKEIFALGGDISKFVPSYIQSEMYKLYPENLT